MSSQPEHLVVVGVSGTGKSTTALLLAERLGRPMIEGDDLHPVANVEAMRAGRALTDADRGPWLRAIRDAMSAAGGPTVVTCSSLRRSYREILRTAHGRVRFLHLVVQPDELQRRLVTRTGHFMPPTLLASQLATLEPLMPDEDGVEVIAAGTPDAIVDEALRLLADAPPPPDA
ncbi:gluconokinase [Cellulomonas xylanilytica]|uniref:Gluconokinase n=1 Tax=Cellulomonas xylanilytica TaxID=233583 RepID=A0A510V638_9CELL|nr:gluconokinase [Cellulomonas xylanilytica]GEK22337.1 gluconokinase [Cellulomonas xylanilytica]